VALAVVESIIYADFVHVADKFSTVIKTINTTSIWKLSCWLPPFTNDFKYRPAWNKAKQDE